MRGLSAALVITCCAVPALAQTFFKEGFVLDNAARQVCQVGADYDPRTNVLMARMGFKFEVVSQSETEVRFSHPDGLEMVWYPTEETGPTCVLTAPADLATDAFFERCVGAAIQVVPNYTLGEPEMRDGAQVWQFASNPEYGTGLVWGTTLIRNSDGAIRIEKRLVGQN